MVEVLLDFWRENHATSAQLMCDVIHKFYRGRLFRFFRGTPVCLEISQSAGGIVT